MNAAVNGTLRVGWSSVDLTPDRPVLIAGQFHARVSEGVMDPITATALALESSGSGGPGGQAIMVSCDLVTIPDALRDAVRERMRIAVPDFDSRRLLLNATHTHTAPEVRAEEQAARTGGGNVPPRLGVELDVLPPVEYVADIADRIARAAADAWRARAPAGVSAGLGFAVVGHNRRAAYFDGRATMYGKTNDPDFSHIEGYEDHSVNLLAVWTPDRRLTGLVVNVACPSQVSEGAFQISADYWHETRLELRRRFGAGLFILPQCSAAGDQSPHLLLNKAAEERMWTLAGTTQRQEIGRRIAAGVEAALPAMERDIAWTPRFEHRTDTVEIDRRPLTETDAREALAEAAHFRAEYAKLKAELDADPAGRQKPRWYVKITAAHRRAVWNEQVAERLRLQERQPRLPVEVHVLRLGDVALASNPFEYYLDYGCQIKARSRAVQTFVIQLAGSGTYVPTARAVAGRSYGAVPASTPVGPEGGRQLVLRTIELINGLWPDPAP